MPRIQVEISLTSLPEIKDRKIEQGFMAVTSRSLPLYVKVGNAYNIIVGTHSKQSPVPIIVTSKAARLWFKRPSRGGYIAQDANPHMHFYSLSGLAGFPKDKALASLDFPILRIAENYDYLLDRLEPGLQFRLKWATQLHGKMMNLYLLNGILAYSAGKKDCIYQSPLLAKLYDQFTEEYINLENELYNFWVDYIFMCSISECRWAYYESELRHSNLPAAKLKSHTIGTLLKERLVSRTTVWGELLETRDAWKEMDSVVSDAKYLFSEYEWSKDYGGKKWHKIVSLLDKRNTVPKIVFIDTAAALSHNSNSFVDKLFDGVFTSVGYFLCILNAKTRSRTVRKLFHELTESIWAQALIKDFSIFIPKTKYGTYLTELYGRHLKEISKRRKYVRKAKNPSLSGA